MPPRELANAIGGRRRPRVHGLIVEEAPDVGRERSNRRVPPLSILFEGLQRDPVEVASELAREPWRVGLPCSGGGSRFVTPLLNADARLRWIRFANDAPDFVVASRAKLVRIEWEPADEQLIEQDAKGVHVGCGIDIRRQCRLLGTHVLERSEDHALTALRRGGVPSPSDGLRGSKIDDLRQRVAIPLGDEHVRWLQVAMDDALLVRVLDGRAYLHEQRQPIARRKALAIAVVGDGGTVDELHDKVRPTFARRSCVEHRRDIGMIHERQRLPLRLESGDDLARVHAGFDQLERHQRRRNGVSCSARYTTPIPPSPSTRRTVYPGIVGHEWGSHGRWPARAASSRAVRERNSPASVGSDSSDSTSCRRASSAPHACSRNAALSSGGRSIAS